MEESYNTELSIALIVFVISVFLAYIHDNFIMSEQEKRDAKKAFDEYIKNEPGIHDGWE